MNKTKNKSLINCRRYYRLKLKYKLIRGGERINLASNRKHLRLMKTLFGIMWLNEDFLYVNPLGVRSERTPWWIVLENEDCPNGYSLCVRSNKK